MQPDRGPSVRFHTDAADTPGLYLNTSLGRFEFPIDQAFEV